VFDNRVLRRISGPKRDEIIGGWRTLHDELHNFPYSPYIIRMVNWSRTQWEGHIARMGGRNGGDVHIRKLKEIRH
jgi:hypothetical protein